MAYFYPHAFSKQRRGNCKCLPPSVLEYGQMDGRTDGGDYIIPIAFLKQCGDKMECTYFVKVFIIIKQVLLVSHDIV